MEQQIFHVIAEIALILLVFGAVIKMRNIEESIVRNVHDLKKASMASATDKYSCSEIAQFIDEFLGSGYSNTVGCEKHKECTYTLRVWRVKETPNSGVCITAKDPITLIRYFLEAFWKQKYFVDAVAFPKEHA